MTNKTKITHKALNGGMLHLQRADIRSAWSETVVRWPTGEKQNAVKCLQSVGLRVKNYYDPKPELIDA